MEIYLSETGNDDASGELHTPLRSLEEAIKRIKSAGEKSTVYLMSGIFRLKKGLVLEGVQDVCFCACEGATPVVSGAVLLQAKELDENVDDCFGDNKNRIKAATLPEGFKQKPFGMGVPVDLGFPMVMANGKYAELSKYPKSEFLKATGVSGKSFSCQEGEHFRFDGIWYYGYPKYEWSDYACPVKKEGAFFELEEQGKYPLENQSRFQFINAADAIEEGEWAVSFLQGKIYYCGDADTIEVSMLDEALIKTQNCRNITFDGITFEMTRGNGVENTGGENVVYENCTVRFISKTAMVFGCADRPQNPKNGNWGYMGDGGENCGARNCNIYNVGMGGIYLSGGDRNKLISCKNFAEGCNIENYSVFARTYRPGVYLSGVGCIARGNSVHNATHMGMEYEGNEQLIEGNEIYDVLKFSDDAAAIYIHCDWTAFGNVIRNNYIHDIESGIGDHGTFAIYIDDCAAGAEICGNYFEGVPCGVFLHGGRNLNVHDNVIKDSGCAFHLKHQHPDLVAENQITLQNRMNSIDIRDEAWEKYPFIRTILEDEPMEPKYNRVYNNMLINTPFGEVDPEVEATGSIDQSFLLR